MCGGQRLTDAVVVGTPQCELCERDRSERRRKEEEEEEEEEEEVEEEEEEAVVVEERETEERRRTERKGARQPSQNSIISESKHTLTKLTSKPDKKLITNSMPPRSFSDVSIHTHCTSSIRRSTTVMASAAGLNAMADCCI